MGLFILVMCSVKLVPVSTRHVLPGVRQIGSLRFLFCVGYFMFYGLVRQQFLPVIPYKPVLLIVGLSILYGGIIDYCSYTCLPGEAASGMIYLPIR